MTIGIFGKILNPFFSEKHKKLDKVILVEKDDIISKDKHIPVKVLKECKDLISPFLSDIYNKSVTLSKFPNSLKLAEVTPAYKKDGTIDKKNYRPISILPSLSKIFKDILTAKYIDM